MNKEHSIGSVEKALAILRIFTRNNPEWNVAEISRFTGYSYPTAFRLLVTLESAGFLHRNPINQKYSLGVAIPELYYKTVALPYMNQIVKSFNETATLYALKNVRLNQRVCVARVESTQHIRSATKTNDILPLTAGCGGYAIMAYLPKEDQEYLKTLDSSVSLERLSLVRKNGYISNDGGRVEGEAGLAVPLFDSNGKFLASLGISSASYRFRSIDIPSAIAMLKEISANISRDLERI